MKFIRPLILLSSFVFFTSCSTNYGVANLGSQARYLEKPTYKGEKETGIYVSSQYYNNGGEGFNVNESETSQWIDLMIHRSHTHKNFNFAYGAFGYIGNYDVNSVAGFEGKKNFQGFGAIAEANYSIHLGRFDWRIIGLRAALTHEGGEFSKFRKQMDGLQLITNRHPNNTPFHYAFTNDLIFKGNDFSVGLYSAFGKNSVNHDGLEFYNTYTSALHFSYSDFTFIGQIFTGFFDGAVYAFGFQYRFQ